LAVFISVTTDPFNDEDLRRRQPQDNVRRPLRGITIKEDTYAVLRAKTATGQDIPFLDSSSPNVEDGIGRSTHYSNFIVQQVQEQRVEKQQIVETFGEDYIYFFGERPRFLNVTGVLINTKDFNWKSEFWENYERYLRGTRLVEQNARLYFYFDDIVVEGYIVSAATTQESMNPYHLPFQFQMFVCNYAILSTVGSVFFQQEAEAAMNSSGVPGGSGIAPDSPGAQQAAADAAARQGASGGLNSFLASASQFLTDANFSIQNTLEVIKNTFYGRRIVVPQGLGQTIYVPPLTNQASFEPAPINRPIHEMTDEYVTRGPTEAAFDNNEIERIKSEMALRTPEELEQQARQQLAKHGIDTSRREAAYTLLGRGAFAAAQTMGAFGIRQVDGIFSGVV
jgi:hypothetical protein